MPSEGRAPSVAAKPSTPNDPATESTQTMALGPVGPTAHGRSRLRAYLRLIRPGNAAMAAAGALTGVVLARDAIGDPLDGSGDVGLMLAAGLPPLLIAGFGNVVNDLRDLELDREAHPHRPLPAGQVRRSEAWALAALLLVTGLAWTQDGGFPAFALAGLNALLLGVYEARLKASGLPGNVLVAVLVASTFLYGAVVATGGLPRDPMLLLLAAMAAGTNLAREVLKDVEDQEADHGRRRTFPLRFGAGPARLLALVVVNLAILASVLAFLRSPADWWLPWLILLALADAVFLVGASVAWMDVGLAQRLLKLAMLVALAAFLTGPLVGDGLVLRPPAPSPS